MAWDDLEFVKHFYFGGGTSISLSATGLSSKIRDAAKELAIVRAGGFIDQIRLKSQQVIEGKFELSFQNSYDFESVVYSIGNAVLHGKFVGRIDMSGTVDPSPEYEGKIILEFRDKFADPIDVLEAVYGSSNPSNAPGWLANAINLGGSPYTILGKLEFNLTGHVWNNSYTLR